MPRNFLVKRCGLVLGLGNKAAEFSVEVNAEAAPFEEILLMIPAKNADCFALRSSGRSDSIKMNTVNSKVMQNAAIASDLKRRYRLVFLSKSVIHI